MVLIIICHCRGNGAYEHIKMDGLRKDHLTECKRFLIDLKNG